MFLLVCFYLGFILFGFRLFICIFLFPFKINSALFLRHLGSNMYSSHSHSQRIGSSHPKVFRKKVLWNSGMVLGEYLWRALSFKSLAVDLEWVPSLVIYFSLLLQFFENFAQISDKRLWIICVLEGAYFVKQLLMAASEILTYSEVKYTTH